MNAAHWTTRAACADRPDLPWTADTREVPHLTTATMREVCAACPVALDCLAAVDDLDITGGFWAGRDRDPNAPTPFPAPAWATGDKPAWATGEAPAAAGWVQLDLLGGVA